MNIKSIILIIINGLILLVVALLSFSFYSQFNKVLDNRILLQLNSIKTLKQNQLENYIQYEWRNFLNSNNNLNYTVNDVILRLPDSIKNGNGIYDFTPYHPFKKTTIGFVYNDKKTHKIKILDQKKVNDILLERTGMGYSGESYLVGTDSKMRTPSRFYPDKKPFAIPVKTVGVLNALSGNYGRGIFEDYRKIEVYSAYSLLKISNLKLVILSEMDVSEGTIPLQDLKLRLVALTFGILLIAVILSLLLTKIITHPIKDMQKSLKIMADGDYAHTSLPSKNYTEIKDMFNALSSLKNSLQGAVKFSKKIGNMNLNANYTPKSQNDVLGKSLIAMRDKLIEFRNNDLNNRIMAKQMLVDGLEQERKRLSRELHDGIGPYLTFLKHYIENNIENTEQKAEIKKIVDDTIAEVRLMSYALMPSSIEDFGVGVTLTNYVESLKNNVKTHIFFEDLTNQNHSKITNSQGIHIFRICQELINNALKHANAKNIRISLSEFDAFISLFYFDDGSGFKTDEIKLGYGIINIKERVEICNGKIVINSSKNNTTFEIEFPIKS